MNEATFDELLAGVQEHMEDSRVYIDGRRSYTKRHRLLVTLSFLAHVPSMKFLASRIGVPPNTLSSSILRKTVLALKRLLIQDPRTKEVRFPTEEAEVRAVMDGFKSKFGLPCKIGRASCRERVWSDV